MLFAPLLGTWVLREAVNGRTYVISPANISLTGLEVPLVNSIRRRWFLFNDIIVDRVCVSSAEKSFIQERAFAFALYIHLHQPPSALCLPRSATACSNPAPGINILSRKVNSELAHGWEAKDARRRNRSNDSAMTTTTAHRYSQ